MTPVHPVKKIDGSVVLLFLFLGSDISPFNQTSIRVFRFIAPVDHFEVTRVFHCGIPAMPHPFKRKSLQEYCVRVSGQDLFIAGEFLVCRSETPVPQFGDAAEMNGLGLSGVDLFGLFRIPPGPINLFLHQLTLGHHAKKD